MTAKTRYVARQDADLASWTIGIKRTELQEMLSVVERPGILSFALGLPDPALFPVQEFAEATSYILKRDRHALQYGPPFAPLKEHIVKLMAEHGVRCNEEQVFLTTGAQQGMNLLTHLLLDPGGEVLVEGMAYTGFLQALEPFKPRILTVPTNPETGIDPDAVEYLLEQGTRPAFMYVIADGHNPLAVSIDMSTRLRLVELARQYRVPIVEDDVYGFLNYNEERLPPLRALDDQWVYYVGSFSKILAPSLRVGWVIVPQNLQTPLSIVKESSDINTSTFTQRIVSAYLDTGNLGSHISILRREYRNRRDTMLHSLRQQFYSIARWHEPSAGVFVWVEFTSPVDTGKLLKVAIEREHVAYIPGQVFSVGGRWPAANSLRLNFSCCNQGLIEEGIHRLAQVFRFV